MENSKGFVMYLHKYFCFPEDLKNDLVYLQRALLTYIRIHQMIMDVFQNHTNVDMVLRRRIIQELELEIYEINAEQQYILIKLRRIIDEFLEKVHNKNSDTSKLIMHKYVSNVINPAVADTSMEYNPINVVPRKTECSLIEQYFEVKLDEPTLFNENLMDMDTFKESVKNNLKTNFQTTNQSANMGRVMHNRKATNNASTSKRMPINKTSNVIKETTAVKPALIEISKKDGCIVNTNINNTTGFQSFPNSSGRISLLKSNGNSTGTIEESLSIIPQVILTENEYSEVLEVNALSHNVEKTNGDKANDAAISTNVRRSRMNLRQALKRAQEAALGPTLSFDSRNNFAATSNQVKLVSEISDTDKEIMQGKAPIVSTITTESVSTRVTKKWTKKLLLKKKNIARTEAVGGNILSIKGHTMSNLNKENSNMIAISTSIEPSVASVIDSHNISPNQISKAEKSMSISSASEDDSVSIPISENFSQELIWPEESQERKSLLYQFSKNGFLRLFNLYTPEECAQLKQRRSKRKRRCVENNTRSYYLYGKSENNAQPTTSGLSSNVQYDSKMKHNSFLLTLQVVKKSSTTGKAKRTCTRATKSRKTNVSDASENVAIRSPVSRSTSSSPDNKEQCNESVCSSDEDLKKCFTCKRPFPINCDIDENVVNGEENLDPLALPQRSTCNKSNIVTKRCPACEREYKEQFKAKRSLNRSLQQIMQKLEMKMVIEQNRRDSLQRECEQFTSQMNNIIKAINCIKDESNVDLESVLSSTSTLMQEFEISSGNRSNISAVEMVD